MQTVKVKGYTVQKLESKQMDGRTQAIAAVGKYAVFSGIIKQLQSIWTKCRFRFGFGLYS